MRVHQHPASSTIFEFVYRTEFRLCLYKTVKAVSHINLDSYS